jgi:hypothetical protein
MEMPKSTCLIAGLLVLAVALAVIPAALAQVTSLYYKEVGKRPDLRFQYA